MSLFFRKINICGRFPFVRLIQAWDNPACLLHILKKNLFYKRDGTDFASKYEKFTFLSGQQTLQELITSGKSLARFSDGEIDLLIGIGIYPPDSNWCQKWSKGLGHGIADSLSSIDPRLMVAVDPPSTFLASRDSVHPIPFEYNMWIDTCRIMWQYLDKNSLYGHCHLFMKSNCPDFNWQQFKNHIREKDIILATGNVEALRHLKLGKKTFFIECGTENAYEKKDEIRAAIEKVFEDNKLDKKETIVFACLGPTASVLAHEMLDTGICFWDTGHIFEFAKKDFIEGVLSNKED